MKDEDTVGTSIGCGCGCGCGCVTAACIVCVVACFLVFRGCVRLCL